MHNLINLLDEIPELDKCVYSLRLLYEVDISSLNDRDFNSWLGLLYDSIELLSQTANNMNSFGNSLSVRNLIG